MRPNKYDFPIDDVKMGTLREKVKIVLPWVMRQMFPLRRTAPQSSRDQFLSFFPFFPYLDIALVCLVYKSSDYKKDTTIVYRRPCRGQESLASAAGRQGSTSSSSRATDRAAHKLVTKGKCKASSIAQVAETSCVDSPHK